MIHEIVNSSNSRSTLYKLWSVIASIVILLIVSSHPGSEAILWATAPLGLLALADASYGSKIKQLAKAAEKAPVTETDILRIEVNAMGLKGFLQGLYGVFSFSVWPFYLTLGGMVVGLGLTALKAPPHPETSKAPGKGFPGTLAHNPAFHTPTGANPIPGFRPPTAGGNPAVSVNPFANHGNGSNAAASRPASLAIPTGAKPSVSNGGANQPSQTPGTSAVAPIQKSQNFPPSSTVATPSVPSATAAPIAPANTGPGAPAPAPARPSE